MHADVHVHERYADWVITMWLIKRKLSMRSFFFSKLIIFQIAFANCANHRQTKKQCAEWLRQLPDYEKEPKVNIQVQLLKFINIQILFKTRQRRARLPVPLAMPISARHTAGCSGSANAGTWGEIVVSFLVDKTKKTLFLKFQVFLRLALDRKNLF